MSSAEDPYAPSPSGGLPPFAPARAYEVRAGLGLTLGQVAWAIAAYCGEPVHPSSVEAWEAGIAVPDEKEIRALAAALWCSPADLVGEPVTLAQCRNVAGLSPSETAAALGMTQASWETVERRNHWQGTAAQTGALLRTLRPPPACFVAACGTRGRLQLLLREAVSGWWPNHVTAVNRIVPLDPAVIHYALERLHFVYQQFEGSAGASPRAAALAEVQASEFLEHIDQHLWRELPAAADRAAQSAYEG
ncbi:helix-turn-helix domain-containing protein [Streptomyces sp. NPDC096339]|uniref:helix-turn-helix domain-containing protein n=1 Tax=Streptomyces sp. NPDC096339 TaxID=3366086 RepID=UPI00380428C1